MIIKIKAGRDSVILRKDMYAVEWNSDEKGIGDCKPYEDMEEAVRVAVKDFDRLAEIDKKAIDYYYVAKVSAYYDLDEEEWQAPDGMIENSGRWIVYDVLNETAANVRVLREISGLSQSGFSAKYHIPTSTIQDWEQGLRKPSDWVMRLITRIVKEDFI